MNPLQCRRRDVDNSDGSAMSGRRKGRNVPGIHRFGIPIVKLEYNKDANFRMAEDEHARAERLLDENKRLQAELRYRQIIEKYNRAHGQNSKITLKEICAREGMSYDAVRQFRSRERKRKSAK
jgi:hypothetical protein